MSFSDYVRLVRTYWFSLLLITALGAAGGVGASYTMTPAYTATAQVLFTPNVAAVGEGGQDLALTSSYLQARMINYRDLVSTPQVLAPAIAYLELTDSPRSLGRRVSASFEPTATLLVVNVSDTSADRATRVVESVARSLITTVQAIETPAQEPAPAEGEQPVAPQPRVSGLLVERPEAGDLAPSSPDRRALGVAGGLLGLLLGLGQALARRARRRHAVATVDPEPRPDTVQHHTQDTAQDTAQDTDQGAEARAADDGAPGTGRRSRRRLSGRS